MPLDYLPSSLLNLRKAARLTGPQLAQRIGRSNSTITHIERGTRKPSIDVLEEWLDACGGVLTVHVAAEDAASPLLAVVAALPPEDAALAARFAAALARIPNARERLYLVERAEAEAGHAEAQRATTQRSAG